MKEKIMKREKGITLIALVITIIVLLILAGVAISMLSGENGILTRASEAKERTEKAQTLEDKIIKSTELQTYFTIEGKDRYASYGYITNISNINDTADNLLADLPDGYTIWSSTGEKIEGNIPLTTGMIVKDKNMEEIAELVKYGDVNGDNILTGIDSLYIQEQMSGDSILQGAYKVAADVNHDGEINIDDANLISSISVNGRIEQNKPAMNPDNIICHTNDEWRTKYVEIIKERFKDTKYTIEYNDTGKEYVLKGGTEGTTAREILDIINEENIYIKNEDTNKKVKEEEVISNNAEDFYFYYEVQEEDKRVKDIYLYFRIDFS